MDGIHKFDTEPELFSNLPVAKLVRQRSAMPQDGLSLERAVCEKGLPLREAVREIAAALDGVVSLENFKTAFSPRFTAVGPPQIPTSRLAWRAAWNLVSVWLLARCADAERRGLVDAEKWFGGGNEAPLLSEAIPSHVIWRAEQMLSALNLDREFWELLPHLLEEHGTGSRASVMRDPTTKTARDAKRKDGVFYTPADVADYMVRRCAGNAGGIGKRMCLDPACGSGVFLLALLRAAESEAGADFDRFEFAKGQLYGMDLSGHALDACAFVLLHACRRDVVSCGLSPWAAWHRLRLNLVQVDALKVEPGGTAQDAGDTYAEVAGELESARAGFVAEREVAAADETWFGAKGLPLGSIFPSVRDGFGLLLGNPPYAAIGERKDMGDVSLRFRSMPDGPAGARANLFPLFIEMMWRLATPERSSAALVTPLSIAYHGGSQYENCRRAMSAAGGRWQFAFFDREPHALFGEEVKTRNAILFHIADAGTPPRGQRAEIETGPLRKWTSRTRHALFDSIAFTPLGAESITHGIPKLGGAEQAEAFCTLRRGTGRLRSWCSRVGTCRPVDAVGAQETHRVFVGGTAYNFLNVYRHAALSAEERDKPMSESPVHCLGFRSDDDAAAAFAALQSRVAFWLWHVWGDGFHVPGWLWDEIPFHRAMFDADSFARLAAHGRALWLRLQQHRFISLNGGKLTIGYRPLHCHEERDAIDALLLTSAGLRLDFAEELRTFVRGNAVVDSSDVRRQHLHRIFPSSPTE
jgi:hypothetical protein